MKKLTSSFLFTAAILSTGIAVAEVECHPGDGPYVAIGAGVSKIHRWGEDAQQQGVRFRSNAIYRLAIGSQFSGLRVEFEPSILRAQYRQGTKGGHLQLASTLGNLYWGLPFEGDFSSYPVAPYIGAGVGFSSVRTNILGPQANNRGHDTVLSYQGIAGIRLAMSDQVGLNIEYRYFSTEKLNFSGKKLNTHSANLGLTFRF